MYQLRVSAFTALSIFVLTFSSFTQQLPTAVPRVMTFSGTLLDASGKPQPGLKGVTFALYKDQHGGAPLWLETQNVTANAAGAYSVLLGSTKTDGLPIDSFASGEARWLGVQIEGQTEQARVLIVAVPYALKAADAETLGGKPATAYLLSATAQNGTSKTNAGINSVSSVPSVNGSGKPGYIAGWVNQTTLTSSNIFQNKAGNIGIGTTQPETTLTVAGAGTFTTNGLYGVSATGATGVVGTSAVPSGFGVNGIDDATSGIGVHGSGDKYGVWGETNGLDSVAGVYGAPAEGLLGGVGVWGFGPGGTGVYGVGVDGPGVVGTSGGDAGVHAIGDVGFGLYASAGLGTALFVDGSTGQGSFFDGNVNINGTLTKSAGSFKIDHPLDPANKYLSHSFVESPDMMNIYNGNATLSADGTAWVTLPAWFQALNRDFRYQLTCIGGFAPVYVASEVQDNRFQIAGGKAGLRVSWQVTGIRQDAYAKAHPIVVEHEKPAKERGTYLFPEGFGQPQSARISAADKAKGMAKVAKLPQPEARK